MTSTSHNQTPEDMVEHLLRHIQKHFYQDNNSFFHRDRKMLIYAISWPSTWLHERGLSTSSEKYKDLILKNLNNIIHYGKAEKYHNYFPRYLLKSIQNDLTQREDQLYAELKHIRNFLQSALSDHKHKQCYDENEQLISVLLQANQITNPKKRKKSKNDHPSQLSLF